LVFTFVRNPFTRILSCYLDKILKDKKEKRLLLDYLGQNEEPIETHLSFYDFLSAIRSQTTAQKNAHWRPQYYQSYHQNMNYDFVGHFESLAADLRWICNKLYLDLETYYQRQDPHRTAAAQSIQEYYGDSEAELVREIYQIDFETFSYNMALPGTT